MGATHRRNSSLIKVFREYTNTPVDKYLRYTCEVSGNKAKVTYDKWEKDPATGRSGYVKCDKFVNTWVYKLWLEDVCVYTSIEVMNANKNGPKDDYTAMRITADIGKLYGNG